jgi:hypothetical protein
MLIIKKIVRRDDGSYEAQWSLSEDQMNFLVTYAINHLLDAGLVQVEEDFQANADRELLEGLDAQELPRA